MVALPRSPARLVRHDRVFGERACSASGRRLLARGKLFVRRPNLSFGQSAAARTAATEHIKPRLLGHWGASPGLNFIYVDLNRLIKSRELNVIYISCPG